MYIYSTHLCMQAITPPVSVYITPPVPVYYPTSCVCVLSHLLCPCTTTPPVSLYYHTSCVPVLSHLLCPCIYYHRLWISTPNKDVRTTLNTRVGLGEDRGARSSSLKISLKQKKEMCGSWEHLVWICTTSGVDVYA